MPKSEAILHYTTSMAMFKKWKVGGIITEDDLQKIEAVLASKYGLTAGSIYREEGEYYAHCNQK